MHYCSQLYGLSTVIIWNESFVSLSRIRSVTGRTGFTADVSPTNDGIANASENYSLKCAASRIAVRYFIDGDIRSEVKGFPGITMPREDLRFSNYHRACPWPRGVRFSSFPASPFRRKEARGTEIPASSRESREDTKEFSILLVSSSCCNSFLICLVVLLLSHSKLLRATLIALKRHRRAPRLPRWSILRKHRLGYWKSYKVYRDSFSLHRACDAITIIPRHVTSRENHVEKSSRVENSSRSLTPHITDVISKFGWSAWLHGIFRESQSAHVRSDDDKATIFGDNAARV